MNEVEMIIEQKKINAEKDKKDVAYIYSQMSPKRKAKMLAIQKEKMNNG